MMERKYSVQELNELRRLCEHKWLFGTYMPTNSCGFSRSYQEIDKIKAVEEMVRTHMIAGHTAEDLRNSETRPPSEK